MNPGDVDPNELAWSRYRLEPRVLQGQCGVDVGCAVFGQQYAVPVGVGAFAADRRSAPRVWARLLVYARRSGCPLSFRKKP
jgi:isopentenyl diphosphate isomerase/L-lactate dehydrogenase-like FMN-dependent dehydrogenase